MSGTDTTLQAFLAAEAAARQMQERRDEMMQWKEWQREKRSDGNFQSVMQLLASVAAGFAGVTVPTAASVPANFTESDSDSDDSCAQATPESWTLTVRATMTLRSWQAGRMMRIASESSAG